jgi:hypothetical protein
MVIILPRNCALLSVIEIFGPYSKPFQSPVTTVWNACCNIQELGIFYAVRCICVFRIILKKKTATQKRKKKYCVASVRKRTIPTKRLPLVSEVSANFFADRGWHVVSVTNLCGRILGFLDRSRYYFFQVAPQLYSRGWVVPVPDPLLFFSFL